MVTLTETSTAAITREETPYFAVSLLKLAVMSICTFGLYEFYWFYENWRRIRNREGPRIKPFLCALFAYFTCYYCFTRIDNHAASIGLHQSIPTAVLAIGWVLTTLLWKLPDPYWLVSSLSFLFILPAQALANRINATIVPDHDPNRRFTAWNFACVAVVAAFLILAIVGSFLPD